MEINIYNVRSEITKFPESPLKEKLLKAFVRKSQKTFWAARQKSGWSGATHFISEKRGQFSTGLLPLILEWAKQYEVEVILNDKRIKPIPQGPNLTPDILKGVILRDYQIAAVEAAIKHERGLIKASTGSGKTIIAAAISKYYSLPTALLVDRVNLATQTRKRYIEYGFSDSDIGIVSDDFNEQKRLITILTAQSGHKIDDLSYFQVAIGDESHHNSSKTQRDFLKSLPNAYYRFGLSGTPFNGDPVEDMYRIAQVGPIIYDIGTQELIAKDVLSKPTIRMIEINKPNVQFISPYINQYKIGIAQNNYRNSIIAKFANGFRGKTLILFKTIEHGQLLLGKIPKAMYMDGKTPTKTRDLILDGFNRSTESILIASQIVDEGIDFASIQHLILAAGEKSIIKGIQRLGRGLRSGGEGDTVNVIDFMDRTSDTLEDHSKKRLKLYKSEGHTVKLFQLGEIDE